MAAFAIIGTIRAAQTFAAGNAIREIGRLRKRYGQGRWRKRKGIATVSFPNGDIRDAEVHWYEANGVGRVEFKIKYLLD